MSSIPFKVVTRPSWTPTGPTVSMTLYPCPRCGALVGESYLDFHTTHHDAEAALAEKIIAAVQAALVSSDKLDVTMQRVIQVMEQRVPQAAP